MIRSFIWLMLFGVRLGFNIRVQIQQYLAFTVIYNTFGPFRYCSILIISYRVFLGFGKVDTLES